MANIEVTEATLKEFNRLKDALKAIYNGQELSNDQIMEAMVGGFFDSLEHMRKDLEAGHHSHGDHECCGAGKCEDDGDCKCC